MKTTWLERLKKRLELSRRQSRRRSSGVEHLEQRTYLSVTSLFTNGTLIVVADADDSIVIQPNPGNASLVQVLANGMNDSTLQPIQASAVERIEIEAGSGDNLIDLNAVSSANFTFQNPATGGGVEILVDGGHGDDTILGSQSFDDSLLGGDGDDEINQSPATTPSGNQEINGGDGNDTLSGGAGNDTISAGDGDDTADGGAGNDSITGGDGNDVLTGGDGSDEIHGNAGEDDVRGGADGDTLHGDSGNDSLTGEDGADFMFGGSGDDALGGNAGEDTLQGNAGNDTLLGGEDSDSVVGGEGDDVLDSGDQLLSISDVVVNPEGDSGFSIATFTISLSSVSALPVTADIRTVDGDATDGADYVGISQTIEIQSGDLSVDVSVMIIGDDIPEFDENFFLVASNVTNALVGDGVGEATIMDDGDGPVQVVFLDFDSATDPTEIQYTQAMRDGVQRRLEENLGPFNVVFTQTAPLGTTYTTLIYNQSPPFGPFGGIALGGIDFRNVNMGDDVLLNASDFMANTGLPETEQNIIAFSAEIGAHELGHAMGLRHRDSFGPVGSGIQQGLANFLSPPYSGPQNATESFNHIMTTPAFPFSAPIFTSIANLYFGARSSMKLAFYAFEGQLLQEQAAPHSTMGTAQPLNLAQLPVPNLATSGAFVGMQFDVEATTVLATIGSTAESDFYSFTAEAGDIINIEAISSVVSNPPRYGNTVDTVVSVFDDTGSLVMLGSSDAMNDDEFFALDSLILDLVIPSDGTYFIEVSSFSQADTGNYELFVTNFNAVTPQLPPTAAATTTTSAPDTLEGGAGNDTIGAGASNDLLDGGAGNDVLFAGDGDDQAFGRGGNDTIRGGGGNDSIFGNGAADLLEGEGGDDLVDGGTSGDRVFGDDAAGLTFGNDTVVGGGGNDIMSGGQRDDVLFGGSGRDVLNGDGGDDTLYGQGSNDILNGGDGNDDLVWRGAGNDIMRAGAGNDVVDIRGDSASEIITVGQSGTSMTVSRGGGTITIETLEDELASPVEVVHIQTFGGFDLVNIGSVDNFGTTVLLVETGDQDDVVNAAGARLGPVHLVVDGGDGNDTLTGSADADTLVGGNGNDELHGGTGADTLRGGAGDDELNGDEGHDRLFGETENDILTGGDGNDTLDGSFGNDTLTGNDGMDSMIGGFGDDNLDGGNGSDVLEAGAGNDVLAGRGGHDTLDGGRNDDILLGNGGHDKLRGDHGNDIIRGHSGDDTIDAGDGNDLVVAGDGNDGIDAGDGDDVVVGDHGDDTIVGGDGDDNLIGGGGFDVIFGQDGDDNLNGNGRNDTLVTGEGNDLIVPSAADTVFGDEDLFPITAEMLNNLDASN